MVKMFFPKGLFPNLLLKEQQANLLQQPRFHKCARLKNSQWECKWQVKREDQFMRLRRDKRIAMRALCPSLLFGSSIKSLSTLKKLFHRSVTRKIKAALVNYLL